jgi:transposase InsO family protein
VIAIQEAINSGARKYKACEHIGLNVRTYQRWFDNEKKVREDARKLREFTPPNKLSPAEEDLIVATVNSAEFADKSPHQIVPILADRGVYIASESTFYRVLRAKELLTHRHATKPATKVEKPKELVAEQPNQIWSWDITYLATTILGQFFYLYLFIDIFSREIVGWQIFTEENSEHASALMLDICRRENISPNQLTLHSDNGSPMKGATMLATLQQLGVAPSRSRPSVSNDNAYSESCFKTLKYRPDYPSKPFDSLAAARTWVEQFVVWYNTEHRHSAIRFVTPEQRHCGEDVAIFKQRKTVYQMAKLVNPFRWSGDTRNWNWIPKVSLNPDKFTGRKSA